MRGYSFKLGDIAFDHAHLFAEQRPYASGLHFYDCRCICKRASGIRGRLKETIDLIGGKINDPFSRGCVVICLG